VGVGLIAMGVGVSEVEGSMDVTPAKAGVTPERQERHRKLVHGVICTVAGGICWGFSGTCAKFLMETYAVDPVWLVCVRELGSFPLFLIAAFLTNREGLVGAVSSREGRVEILKTAVFAILLSQVGYLESIDWTNSATATVLQSLNLLLVLGYVCVRKHRRPRKREMLGIALALAGTYLIATGGNPGQLQLPIEGIGWSAVMVLAAALLAIVPAKALARWGSFVVNGYAMLVSGVILAAFTRPWDSMPALDMVGWAWVAAIIVVGTFGAYALFLQGVKEVGALKANLLGISEPVTATILSVLWMGASFSPLELVGFVLVFVMVYLTV
jgi:drug/metabolite transporter (DMT)-like permease